MNAKKHGQVSIAALIGVFVLTAIAVVGAIYSPHGGRGDDDPKIETEVGLPRIVVFVLDSTGSFQYFFAGTRKALWAACHLRMGDQIYVITIGNYTKEGTDLRVAPNPELYARLASLPTGRVFCPDMEKYQADLVEQIKALRFEGIKNTDVYGALFYASTILKDEAPGGKYLIVCSDMGDTVGREDLISRTDLSGVKVTCLYFPTDLVVAEDKSFKPDPDYWYDQFQNWDAESVEIYNHVQSGTVNPLSAPCED